MKKLFPICLLLLLLLLPTTAHAMDFTPEEGPTPFMSWGSFREREPRPTAAPSMR